MKKTTYIMASLTLAGLALMVGLIWFIRINYTSSESGYDNISKNIVIDGNTTDITLQPFSVITIMSSDKSVQFNDNIRFEITESDSTDYPVMTLLEDWLPYLTTTVCGDSLKLNFTVEPEAGFRYCYLEASTPISITIPRNTLKHAESIYKYVRMTFNRLNCDSLSVTNLRQQDFIGCNIAALSVENEYSEQKLYLDGTTIGSLSLASSNGKSDINGESNCFIADVTTLPSNDFILNFHSTPIGRFTWDGDGSRNVTVTSDIHMQLSTVRQTDGKHS